MADHERLKVESN